MNTDILICECSSSEHQIIVRQIDDKIYCTIHLSNGNFWFRLKKAIKYIFGYKCKYGNFEEFVLTEDNINKLNQIKSQIYDSKGIC